MQLVFSKKQSLNIALSTVLWCSGLGLNVGLNYRFRHPFLTITVYSLLKYFDPSLLSSDYFEAKLGIHPYCI